MTVYRFLEIDGMHECSSIIEIKAGSESDAWDLINESSPSNYSTNILLTPRLKKSLKASLKL